MKGILYELTCGVNKLSWQLNKKLILRLDFLSGIPRDRVIQKSRKKGEKLFFSLGDDRNRGIRGQVQADMNDGPNERSGRWTSPTPSADDGNDCAGLVSQDFTALQTGSPRRTYASQGWKGPKGPRSPVNPSLKLIALRGRYLFSRLIHEAINLLSIVPASRTAHLWTRNNVVES